MYFKTTGKAFSSNVNYFWTSKSTFFFLNIYARRKCSRVNTTDSDYEYWADTLCEIWTQALYNFQRSTTVLHTQ